MQSKARCLLTGASGGIGSAIAQVLAQQGYSVVLQGRDKERLQALKAQLAGEHSIVIGDLTCTQDRTRILENAFSGGHIDLLVNGAGISDFSDFKALSQLRIEQLIHVNLTSPILLTQAYLQKIGDKKATIINIGSALGAIGFPGFDVYCASKFGLRGFSESLSRELADSAVRVAYFAPRTTQTEINSNEVITMNRALGSKVDSADFVAREFIKLLNSQSRRKTVGWPEKLFARINGCLPEVVDKALKGKLKTVKKFTHNVSRES
ncbi:MAG: SDR family oxidoreductase [Psychromonas sp.]|nr:SDR family oxidoreductase [Psychromonas sp.]